MITVGLVFAGLAALLHVYIWVMESLTWTSPRTRATFGITAEEAEATQELAFNQGFYNLFLALLTAGGIIAYAAADDDTVGVTLVLAGTGSMVAAALVLLLSSPDKARAAITQLAFPAVAVVLVALGL